MRAAGRRRAGLAPGGESDASDDMPRLRTAGASSSNSDSDSNGDIGTRRRKGRRRGALQQLSLPGAFSEKMLGTGSVSDLMQNRLCVKTWAAGAGCGVAEHPAGAGVCDVYEQGLSQAYSGTDSNARRTAWCGCTVAAWRCLLSMINSVWLTCNCVQATRRAGA